MKSVLLVQQTSFWMCCDCGAEFSGPAAEVSKYCADHTCVWTSDQKKRANFIKSKQKFDSLSKSFGLNNLVTQAPSSPFNIGSVENNDILPQTSNVQSKSRTVPIPPPLPPPLFLQGDNGAFQKYQYKKTDISIFISTLVTPGLPISKKSLKRKNNVTHLSMIKELEQVLR